MKLVVLESPYAGDIEKNVAYARACVKDSLSRGEAPIASHLLYTQPGILCDEVVEQRQWGINAGLAWASKAETTVAYVDYGITRGMQYGLADAAKVGRSVEFRTIMEADDDDDEVHCPICKCMITTWIDDAPHCREHGRFGWWRRLFWVIFGGLRARFWIKLR